MTELQQWANFYVIASAAAATLLGLLFVVITLAAERGSKATSSFRGQLNPQLARIYLTPAVIYFCSVLLTSALLTIPNQTRLSAIICICLHGITGLGYSGFLAIRRGVGGALYEERSDLFPYAVIPLGAYVLMAAGGLMLLPWPQIGLDLVAASMLTLLGIAIRNSWAIATTIISAQG